ncbi:DUF4157 domain-containing protein [Saccharothrix lopnurensis]|uniref:DUF4157 domain-containing protein n=1 Tax=Saccharothrix lopnurensis TaxID=1670621 RepID=A0ABW1PBN6_9PSEU
MHAHHSEPEKGVHRRAGRARQDPEEQAAVGGAEEVLRLQRSMGNAATSGMIASARGVRGMREAQEAQEAREAQDAAAHPVQRSAVDAVVNRPGSRLPADVRAEAEARTGVDLSDVRVHTDDAAARSAEDLGASAYTTGEDMVFTPGSFNWKTLLHEAEHVRQQREGSVEGTDQGDGTRLSHPSDRHERQAEQRADEALRDDPDLAHRHVLGKG